MARKPPRHKTTLTTLDMFPLRVRGVQEPSSGAMDMIRADHVDGEVSTVNTDLDRNRLP